MNVTRGLFLSVVIYTVSGCVLPASRHAHGGDTGERRGAGVVEAGVRGDAARIKAPPGRHLAPRGGVEGGGQRQGLAGHPHVVHTHWRSWGKAWNKKDMDGKSINSQLISGLRIHSQFRCKEQERG